MVRKKTSPASPKADRNAKWYRRYPWIGVSGAALIFLSWVFQNHFAREATEERLRLERTQLAIDLQEIRFEQWNILYLQETSKDEPDPKIVAAAAFKALQSYANLAGWSFARIRSDERDAEIDILEKRKVQQNLLKLYTGGNVDALKNDLKNVATIEKQLKITDQLTKLALRKAQEA